MCEGTVRGSEGSLGTLGSIGVQLGSTGPILEMRDKPILDHERVPLDGSFAQVVVAWPVSVIRRDGLWPADLRDLSFLRLPLKPRALCVHHDPRALHAC